MKPDFQRKNWFSSQGIKKTWLSLIKDPASFGAIFHYVLFIVYYFLNFLSDGTLFSDLYIMHTYIWSYYQTTKFGLKLGGNHQFLKYHSQDPRVDILTKSYMGWQWIVLKNHLNFDYDFLASDFMIFMLLPFYF